MFLIWEFLQGKQKLSFIKITNASGIFSEPLPIPYEKYKDLQVLKEFCGQDARKFYTNLPHKTPKETKKQKKN